MSGRFLFFTFVGMMTMTGGGILSMTGIHPLLSYPASFVLSFVFFGVLFWASAPR